MTRSLDGFVADRSGRVGDLYPDLAALEAPRTWTPPSR